MRTRGSVASVFQAVLLVGLAACSGGDLPQKEHSFTGNLAEEQRAQARDNRHIRDRIAREKQADQFRRLSVSVAKLESDAPYAGLGFLSNTSKTYVVQRDSSAALFSADGSLTPLDRLAKRVDHADLATPYSNRVLGLSAHGTQALWNGRNLSQQLVIRPQKSTFGRVKMFDAEVDSRGGYLITASEGGLIETWSLSSGNLLNFNTFRNYQPRQIARNTSVNQVIFGTNDGQVRIWRGGGSSHFQYRHAGPLLELIRIPERHLIASVGKDGQLIVFDMKTRKIVLTEQFAKADYQLMLSKDARRLIASPAVGAPLTVDLETLKTARIRHVPTNITTKVAFAASSNVAISQHGGSGMMFWNVALPRPVTFKVNPKASGRPIDFALARDRDVAAILTSKDQIEYWDVATRKYLGPAFHSRAAGIARFALSADASWLVVALSDGQVVRMKVAYNETQPVELE